jgi:hypothetical protein
VAGAELDAQIEREIAEMPKADVIYNAIESPEVTAVSVDSAWLKHCAPPKQKFMGRQVNIVAGRATRADGTSQVVVYVGKRVASPAARLDHFLMHQGVDGANCRRPRDGSLSFVTLSPSLVQQISHHERAAYLLDQPAIAKVSQIND